ncbi:MAG: two-component regulator propeller domain-containing protein, partial [Betaproteobacteria bacterium]
KPLAEFMHQTWSVDNGLPQSTIRGISQTTDGYLWFATHEGVARFDGLVFTVFDEGNTPSLHGSGVSALLAQKDGGLLLGLRDGGIVRYFGGKFETLAPKGGLPTGSISVIAEDPSGALWVGTSANGLARIENGESRIFSVNEGLPGNWVTAVRPVTGGDIWIGTSRGLVIYRAGSLVKKPTQSWLDASNIVAILQDDKQRVWFATSGEGLAVREGETVRRYLRRNGLASDTLARLHIDRDGALWIGTLEGVQRLVGEEFESFAAPDGLTNNFIREIFEDAEGNIWIGTDRGIDRFRDSLISTWGIRKGLAEEFVRVVLEDRRGRIWVGTSDGLFSITATAVKRYSREQGLLNGAILSLAEDADGTLWVGTNGGGLHRMKGERFEQLSGKLGLSTASVRAIVTAKDGSLWIGTNSGLISWVWRGQGNPARLGIAEGLPTEQINALLEDEKGRIWVGARGGLGVIEKDDHAHAKSLGKQLGSSTTVLALNADTEGRIWVSTVNGLGLLSVGKDGSASTLKMFSGKEGIHTQTYFSAIDDARGNLWVCSNRGIVKISKAQVDDVMTGKRRAVEPLLYGRAEGMTTAQCNGASQPAGWRTANGRMLFPTARGLAVADPGRKAANSLRAPPVHIKSVMVDAEPVTPNAQGVVEVPPGKHRLEISYVGLNLADPEKVRYRYQLTGFDRDWVEAGAESKAVYTNVSPGSYPFNVLAGIENGNWNKDGASLVIEQKPNFYQQVWFRVLATIVIVLVAAGAYRGRIAQLNALGRKLQLMVDDRTRDLEREKQKLEAASDEKARLLIQVADAARAYEKLSKEDSLTGLSNRRELDRFLAHEFERAVRHGRTLSVALADLDFFKKINDLHSHAVGDEVLREVANILRVGCRSIDMVGRYGGEEFVLVLPEADHDVALQICERLRAAIENFDWESKHAGPKVTMSFGLATLAGESSFERLVALADEKLYEAKEGGRNRVCS